MARTDRELWQDHKGNAKRRGIEFRFTFEEWTLWWEKNLGPDWREKRGSEVGKYVMARYGDKGAYEAENVKCILHADNIRECCLAVSDDVARDVYTSSEKYEAIMLRTGLTFGTIHDIRSGRRRWALVVAGLTKGKRPVTAVWARAKTRKLLLIVAQNSAYVRA